MSSNRSGGAIQVFDNSVASINLALGLILNRLDAAAGLRGRAQVYDRLGVSPPTVGGDAVNQGSLSDSQTAFLTQDTAQTVTGLKTFSRDTNAPFAVASGAAVVANLDAEKWAGQAYAEGTCLVTGTGFASAPTGTALFCTLGHLVGLFLPQVSGTSNATTLTLTGLPAALQPTQTSDHPVFGTDNGTDMVVWLRLTGGSTTLTLFRGDGTAFTPSGTKRLYACCVAYVRL